MADVESPEQQPKDMNGSVTEVNSTHMVPQDTQEHEEVEMETVQDQTNLDVEMNTLLPIPPQEIEQMKPSRRSSTVSKRRKSSVKSERLMDEYYDDDDWKSDEDEDEEENTRRPTRNVLVLAVQNIQNVGKNSYFFINRLARGHLIALAFLAAFTVYFIRAMAHETDGEPARRLIGCTILGVFIIVQKPICHVLKKVFIKIKGGRELSPRVKLHVTKARRIIRWLMYLALTGTMIYVIIDQADKSPRSLRSIPGLGIFMLFCFLVSKSPSNVNWHVVYWSFSMQFLCALFALRWGTGRDIILWVQARLDEFYSTGDKGSEFIFGKNYQDHMIAFGATPRLFLANAVLAVLYYLGAMQTIVKVVGSFFSFVLEVSPIEAMSVANSIFMEGVVAVMSIKPYLGRLTKSQLFLVVTATFCSLGGGYMGTLTAIGVALKDIIPAMLISAPATFAVCKLMMPETDKMVKKQRKEGAGKFNWDIDGTGNGKTATNIVDAAQEGAVSMLMVAGNFIVVGYVFVALIAWANLTVDWFGQRVGANDLSIEKIFSYVLFPVSLAMGVDWDDCRRVAMLIGYRIASVNILAFMKLLEMKINKGQYYQYMMATNFTGPITEDEDDITLDLWNTTLKNGFLSERSETIVTYSLCGFSSFLFGTITLGIMYALLPRRRTWLAKMFGPALLAGNIANCMTGCFAGIFF